MPLYSGSLRNLVDENKLIFRERLLAGESECCANVMLEYVRAAHSVASALAHMHARRVLHRDVKAENVFVVVDSNERVASCALGDFGESVQVMSGSTPPHDTHARRRRVDGFASAVRAAAAHVLQPGHARVRRARGCRRQRVGASAVMCALKACDLRPDAVEI